MPGKTRGQNLKLKMSGISIVICDFFETFNHRRNAMAANRPHANSSQATPCRKATYKACGLPGRCSASLSSKSAAPA
jgi:hypothetical protein